MSTPDASAGSTKNPRKSGRRAAVSEPKSERPITYVVRLSRAERDELSAHADAHGMKMADYVRARVFGYRLPVRQLAVDEATYRVLSRLELELRNLGSNVNQLAHQLHLGFEVNSQDVTRLISETKPLLQELRHVLVLRAQEPEDSEALEAEWEDGDK